MPCYRAKSDHLSAATSRPGVGASWTTFWANVPCCSSSSSSTGGGTTSSSSGTGGGTTSSSSAAGGTTSSGSSTGGGTTSSSSTAGGTTSSSSTTTAGGTTSSSSTAGGTTSSSSATGGTGSSYAAGYHKYLAYPCGAFDSADCATQWETLSGGMPTQIWHTDDTAVKFTCNTNSGGALIYTVTRVWGITGLTAGQCALLIRDDTITPVSVMYQVGTGTQTCNACAYTLTTGNE